MTRRERLCWPPTRCLLKDTATPAGARFRRSPCAAQQGGHAASGCAADAPRRSLRRGSGRGRRGGERRGGSDGG